jgi:hypothetical protein
MWHCGTPGVEDKEELVNIRKMKVSFDVSCQIIVCLTHCIYEHLYAHK